MTNKQLKHFESLCAQETKDTRSNKTHILPIYASSSFVFDNIDQGIDIFNKREEGYVYSRYGNPTVDSVARKLAQMEAFDLDKEAYCFLTSTGMSAIHVALSAVLKSGQKILTQGNLYGGTTNLFRKVFSKFNIETIFCDLQNEKEIQKVLNENPDIALIYLETPTNPTLSCIDIKKIVTLAKEHNCFTAIDNTFATPYLQRPLNDGVDIIIHSTTKYLNGHGNSIAGAIITQSEEIRETIFETLKLGGASCNPFDAWLLHNGMKTLSLRMDKHSQNAMGLATYLSDHPAIGLVNYPGLETHPSHHIAKKQMTQFGGMMSIELKSGLEGGIKFMNKLKTCTMAPTLGDIDTLILHPASSSHLKVPKEMREKNGITDGLIRISVGIESIHDLIEDLDQALS